MRTAAERTPLSGRSTIYLLDLISRLERCFGVRINRDQLSTMVTSNDPPDIRAADLFDFIRREVFGPIERPKRPGLGSGGASFQTFLGNSRIQIVPRP